MISSILFFALCASVYAGGDEDDGFDKWDGMGLGVSVGILLFAAVFLYLKEFYWCPPNHEEESDSEESMGGRGAPNPNAVNQVFMDLLNALDTQGKHNLDKSDLLQLTGSERRASELLNKFDLDRSGDLSVFELRNYYADNPDLAQADLQKIKEKKAAASDAEENNVFKITYSDPDSPREKRAPKYSNDIGAEFNEPVRAGAGAGDDSEV